MTNDRKFSIVLLVLCLALWFVLIPTQVAPGRDTIYPKFITLWLALSGVFLLFASKKGAVKERDEAFLNGKGILKVAIIVSLFLVYTLAIEPFGFFIPSGVFLVVLMLFSGIRDWKIVLGVPLAVLVFSHLLVERLLRFPLP